MRAAANLPGPLFQGQRVTVPFQVVVGGGEPVQPGGRGRVAGSKGGLDDG